MPPGRRNDRSASGAWICIRTYYDAFHGFPPVMLFDLDADHHEQHDVAGDHPQVVEHALSLLGEWAADALSRSPTGIDPLWTVLRTGDRGTRGWTPTGTSSAFVPPEGAQWADQFAVPPPAAHGATDQAFLIPATPSEHR